MGLLKRVGSGQIGEEEEEGEGVGESETKGKFILTWVISLFSLRSFDGFCGPSSSPEESESVASWSVRMIRRSFLFWLWVFPVVLHGGSTSK